MNKDFKSCIQAYLQDKVQNTLTKKMSYRKRVRIKALET